MTTKTAFLFVVLALALAVAIGTIVTLALPSWMGSIATGAIFA